VTPSLAQIILNKNLLTKANSECLTMVVDKIDLHQAFDLDQDLIELPKCDNFPQKFNCVFTTNADGGYQDD